MSKVSDPKQLEIMDQIQQFLLLDLLSKVKDGTATPTDRATMARLLMHYGWELDPNALASDIREKLTAIVSPEDFDDDDL